MAVLKLTLTVVALFMTLMTCKGTAVGDGNGNCGLTDMLSSLKEAHTSCDSCGFVTQVLVREIEDRVKLQARFDQIISQLGEKSSQSSRPTQAIVAFSARVQKSLTGLPRERTIVFGEVFTNVGDAYNGETGEFHCPVSGLYQFTVTILSNYRDRIETEMMAGGKSRMLMYSGSGDYHGSGTNSVLLQLNAGDVVYVRTNGVGNYVHHYWSTFNGFLVQKAV